MKAKISFEELQPGTEFSIVEGGNIFRVISFFNGYDGKPESVLTENKEGGKTVWEKGVLKNIFVQV